MRTARERKALERLVDAAACVTRELAGVPFPPETQRVVGARGVEALAYLYRAHGELAEARSAVPERKPRHLKASRKTAAERRSWDEIKRAVYDRAGGRCEVMAAGHKCLNVANDAHHIFGKSHESEREVLAVCREHHDEIQNAKDPALWWRRMAIALRRLGFVCEAKRAWSKATYSRNKDRLSREA